MASWRAWRELKLGRESGAGWAQASEPPGASTRQRSETDASGALESLLFSSSGRLISGTMTNVFLVRDNEVATPRLDLCGVAASCAAS